MVFHETAWPRPAATGQPRLVLVAGAVALLLFFGWVAVQLTLAAISSPRDFFQDYVSARQLLAGQPLYPDLAPFREAFDRPPAGFGIVERIEVNAHPPISVLLALPVAGLPYEQASLVWEVTGIGAYAAMWWLVLEGTGLRPRRWGGWLVVTLAALLHPAFLPSLAYVTMSPYLGLLLVAVWFTYRRGQRGWAAALLALAIALKLYPALLVGVFLLRRDWRTALLTGAATAALGLLTLPILGLDAYRDYLAVLPRIAWWTTIPGNWSLPGLFGRLFTAGPLSHPLVEAPPLATVLTIGACGLAIGLPSLLALRASRPAPRAWIPAFDALYACGLLVLLLVSPLTWAHYTGPSILAWCVAARRALAGSAGPPPATRRMLVSIAVGGSALPVLLLQTISLGAGDAAQEPAVYLFAYGATTWALFGLLALTLRELYLTRAT